MQFCLFWCHSWSLKMFLVTFDFEHKSGATQMMLICKCKSYKINNKMFFNMFSFSKTKDELVVIYIKIQLFSGTILHSASNEPDAYLEPSHKHPQDSVFAKIVNSYEL